MLTLLQGFISYLLVSVNVFTQLFPSKLLIDASLKSRMAIFAWDGRKTEQEELYSHVPRGKNSGGIIVNSWV